MSIDYLPEGTALTVAQANAVFTAVDTALSVLFNGQSPLLYLSFNDGGGLWEQSGLAGLLIVLGDQSQRKILDSVASHDQDAIDTAAAAGAAGLTDVLTAAGYDVFSAVVDSPGYGALSAARGPA